MELVYLWGKEYKNIYKQGFNFSPRFRCEYDEEKDKLEIIDKEETGEFYPKNFFGDNINITAIVGENGSGKSSLLTGISNDFLIFKIDEKYYTRGFNRENIVSTLNFEDDSQDQKVILDFTIYLDFDLIKINPIEDFFSYSHQNIYQRNLYHYVEGDAVGNDFDFNIAKFRENFFNLILEYHTEFKANIFTYEPTTIILSDFIYGVNSEGGRWEKLHDLVDSVQNRNFTKEKLLVYIYNQLAMQVDLFKTFPEIGSIDDILVYEDLIISHASSINFDINETNKKEYYNFFADLNSTEEWELRYFNDIYLKHKKVFLSLIEHGYITVNFKDDKEREFFNLSSGERKFFTESLMIFDAISKNGNNDILIVLDEPDLALHPDWQKKYMNEMIKILTTFSDKRFHLIVTTHSPFILSDLPKENVIFLEKGKQVYPFENGKQTFGANIHTLLSHGFFMKDGLLGEFAKDKINDVINFLNGNKSLITTNDDAQNLINIIGEPVIKKQLQKMLDSKRLSKIDEIDLIKNQMKELSKRLEEIENAKD